MRASPADCKSVLHLGGALCLFCPLPALPLYLPAEYNSALPALPTASRRSAWAALCAYFALYLPFPLAARRVQLGAPSFPLAARRVQLGAPISPWLPAEYNSALPVSPWLPFPSPLLPFPYPARRLQVGAPSG